MSYNHPRWPSPRAKIVAKNLSLDWVIGNYGEQIKMKRITHAQALELLRKKAGVDSVEEFLAMPEMEAWLALGCTYDKYLWDGRSVRTAYNPLYGIPRNW